MDRITELKDLLYHAEREQEVLNYRELIHRAEGYGLQLVVKNYTNKIKAFRTELQELEDASKTVA
jgi:hypothetical protein